jgi:hypothetical protein
MIRCPNAVTRQRRDRGIFATGRRRGAGAEAADLGTLARRIVAKPDGGRRQLGAEIAIREAVDCILTTHERGKELAGGPSHGIEGFGQALPGGDGIEAA